MADCKTVKDVKRELCHAIDMTPELLRWSHGDIDDLIFIHDRDGRRVCRVNIWKFGAYYHLYFIEQYTKAAEKVHKSGWPEIPKTSFDGYRFHNVHDIIAFVRSVIMEKNNTSLHYAYAYAKNDIIATEEIMKKDKKTPLFKVNSIEYTLDGYGTYDIPRREITINAEILPGAYFKNGPKDVLINAIESIGNSPIDDIKDVIFNNPATIIIWKDGTKTVVKAENEPFDPEKGLAMAIAKKFLGNKYNYYDIFKKYVGRYEKKQNKKG